VTAPNGCTELDAEGLEERLVMLMPEDGEAIADAMRGVREDLLRPC